MGVILGERSIATTANRTGEETIKKDAGSEVQAAQKKIEPQQTAARYISFDGLQKRDFAKKPMAGTKKPEQKKPVDPKDLQPDPNQRTVTSVEGRIVGYDAKFNPLTEQGLKDALPPNKLAEQPLDHAEASASLSRLIGSLTGNERINQEFFSYLEQKYADASRPPDGLDVYQNPQNYTPEQKLARYIDLVKVKGQFEAYREARLQPNTGQMRTILNEPEVRKDIEQAMQTLLEDPSVAGLLSSEYLQGTRQILDGKRFQNDEGKHDAAYTEAVEKLRSDIKQQFRSEIVEGGLFKDGVARGVNEQTILTNYNTALKAFGSVLPADVIEQNQAAIQKAYNEFYSSRVEPLLPDAEAARQSLVYSAALGFEVPEAQKDHIGLVTPTINGDTYADLGLTLKTEGYMDRLAKLKVDPETLKEIKALGLSPTVPQDGFTAAFLPTVAAMATQIFGTSEAAREKRSSFASLVLQELRPLVGRLDGGLDGLTLAGSLERVRHSMLLNNHPLSAYRNEVTTALNGLVRGANLTANKLLVGMYRAGSGYALQDVQSLTALAVGYEGKGLARTSHPEGVLRDTDQSDNSALAKTVFGTEDRMWDSSLLQRFSPEGLERSMAKMTDEIATLLPNSVVRKPIIDVTREAEKSFDEILQTYATSVAKGLFGDDEAAVTRYKVNLMGFVGQLWSLSKPGGSTNQLFAIAKELASNSKGFFFDGAVSIDQQMETMAKYGSAFLSIIRTVQTGVLSGGKFDKVSLSWLVLGSVGGAAQIMDAVGSSIKPSLDAKILFSIGEYADAAKQATRTALTKGSALLGGAVGMAVLPLDIFAFVRNLKAGKLDTAEKIFTSIAIGADVGIAIDSALGIVKTLVPATVLQTSRFASLFMGTGGAIVSALGAAFSILSTGALLFLNFWQDVKTEKAYKKAGAELDHNLSRLTGNTTSDYLKLYPEAGDPWTTEAEKQWLYQKHLDNMYKDDLTPFDWDAVRQANRQRFEMAA
ncbi:hypothetical protein [Rhizobium sp. FKY42]|uniref:hypothetical protein n=1 Tax=Rhizobium sp. FKY42 TaxID=2562310 RepID=UPI0010BF898B|nr:hypothetical protein [Rhizobium sp. FKY42]